MKRLRTYGLYFLLVSVLGFLGLYPLFPVSPDRVTVTIHRLGSNPTVCTVEMNPVCSVPQPDPDTVCVAINSHLIWTRDKTTGTNYSVHFAGRTPFHDGSLSGAPIPSVNGQVATRVTSDDQCRAPSSSADSACYFSYDLYKNGLYGSNDATPCADPGVRVVPPTLVPFWVWIEQQLANSGK